jgi:sialate O-acetylesterase
VKDFEGKWAVCSPESVKDFSAVGYFFGRELQNHLEVPIGLIDNAWGGSACDAWIRRDRMEGNPLYQPQLEKWDALAREVDEAMANGKFDKNSKDWQNKADQLVGQHRPANLYHARLGPIMPYAIRGVIWYQGESNAGRAFQYREMFPLMISSWREDWGQDDFPFYWVQLADYMEEKPEPGESAWAELREAQTMAQDRLPNTGEAVIIDLGEGADIHPRNKLEVAKRLARWALAEDYGREIVSRSPRFDSLEKADGKLIVKFKNGDGGLRTIDDKRVLGFAIAGEDHKWVWADAKLLDDDRVEVSSQLVSEPVAVRYGWADNPVCNLYNMAGLPVTPFRTDNWPGVTDKER